MTEQTKDLAGEAELRSAEQAGRPLLAWIILFSSVVNILLLTSPLYMLQVYDRVLGSRSEETLIALTALMAFMFLIMGVLDFVRARLLLRVGFLIQSALDKRVFKAAFKRLTLNPNDTAALAAQRDVEAIRTYWGSQAPVALMDLPWTLVFIAALFLFHPALGWLAIGGGLLVFLIAVANQALTKDAALKASEASVLSDHLSESLKSEAETVRSLGMTEAAFKRWIDLRNTAATRSLTVADRGGALTATSRTFRMFLQSLMLGAGAYLVLQQEMTAGAMIAGSILMGRALQPIDQIVAQWPLFLRAREARVRLARLLGSVSEDAPKITLPRPIGSVEVEGLTVTPPGTSMPVLQDLSFSIRAGEALGILGPTGAGKSSLARSMTGLWPAVSGSISLGGASLSQYGDEQLGQLIGYLPQRVTLFEGTVAENIARLDLPEEERVIAAARTAGAHEMILKLPQGYNTRISTIRSGLSGGQLQRIGLARAFYGAPVLLVLDEPNSSLDGEGSMAVNEAIKNHKAAGGSVMVMAHRPSTIVDCEQLLVLDRGTRRLFGPRNEVMAELVKAATGVQRLDKLSQG